MDLSERAVELYRAGLWGWGVSVYRILRHGDFHVCGYWRTWGPCGGFTADEWKWVGVGMPVMFLVPGGEMLDGGR